MSLLCMSISVSCWVFLTFSRASSRPRFLRWSTCFRLSISSKLLLIVLIVCSFVSYMFYSSDASKNSLYRCFGSICAWTFMSCWFIIVTLLFGKWPS